MLNSYHTKKLIEAGCDEAGRGCLAGPVVAAAVILPPNFKHPLIADSKKMHHEQRLEAREVIIKGAINYAVGVLSEREIDRVNIHNASYLAMHQALDQLAIRPQHIIIDGNRFIPYHDIAYTCVVKGDDKYLSIAAASILAKTHRDELMVGSPIKVIPLLNIEKPLWSME
ncbi:MAG TPA: ribonuclease HII [Saprospiraceae bacterium]|nr:ribonuclease HII [Saprospiraceae bacterium]